MNDLELAIENDVEGHVVVALLEDDLAVFENLRVGSPCGIGSLRRKELVVGIAIGPGLAELAGRNDRVVGCAKVCRCVAVGRVVAAADVAAGQADPEMNPLITRFEALFAACGRAMSPSRHLTRDVCAGIREIDVVVGLHCVIMRLDQGLVEGGDGVSLAGAEPY
jgi:hypothetical protein